MSHGARSLLRRTAYSLYGAGRSLERAEDLARIVLVHGDTHVDLPVGEDVGWSPLLEIAGLERDFVDAYPAFTSGRDRHSPLLGAPEAEVVDFLLCAPVNHDSVLANLGVVREAMRSARDAVPREVWEHANAAWLAAREDTAALERREGRVRWLREVLSHCERINGALWATMLRDDALAVIRLGQHLERARLTCRFLSVRAESATKDGRDADSFEYVRATSLLRSLGAYHQYRRATPARPGPGSLIGFILCDDTFPRSVASSLELVREQLKELPGCEDALAACAEAALFVGGAPTTSLSADDLRWHLGQLGGLLDAVSERVESALFTEIADLAPTGRRPSPARRSNGAPEVVARYRVVHRTTYRYPEPAEDAQTEAHLRPRTTLRQSVASSTLDVVPSPESRTETLDGLGNHLSSFVVRGPFEELTVTATSEVALSAAPPVPVGPPWESVRSTLDRDRRLDSRLARVFRSPSRLVPVTEALAAYAGVSFEPRRPLVEAVRDLCRRINRDFSYEPGFTSVTTPLLEVFETRRGVCQDFAHVAVGCLRSMGLAGRYVSGYIENARPCGGEQTGADASHAWVSTYLPGWGWLDFDPTNDLVVCERHVTTAWGRDYLDVSPLWGSVAGGGEKHDLEVAVEVTPLPL